MPICTARPLFSSIAFLWSTANLVCYLGLGVVGKGEVDFPDECNDLEQALHWVTVNVD